MKIDITATNDQNEIILAVTVESIERAEEELGRLERLLNKKK